MLQKTDPQSLEDDRPGPRRDTGLKPQRKTPRSVAQLASPCCRGDFHPRQAIKSLALYLVNAIRLAGDEFRALHYGWQKKH